MCIFSTGEHRGRKVRCVYFFRGKSPPPVRFWSDVYIFYRGAQGEKSKMCIYSKGGKSIATC